MKGTNKNIPTPGEPITLEPGSSESGFTLLETSIAFVTMLVVMLGVASLFFHAASNNLGADNRQMSMAVAQKRVEWLRKIPLNAATRTQAYSYPNGGLGQTSTAGVTETVTSSGRTYEVVTVITDRDTDLEGTAQSNAIPPTIKVITVSVRPLNSSHRNQVMSSAFGAVRLKTVRTLIQSGPHEN